MNSRQPTWRNASQNLIKSALRAMVHSKLPAFNASRLALLSLPSAFQRAFHLPMQN